MEWSEEESLEVIQKKFLEKALEEMKWRIWEKKSGDTFGIVAYKSLKVLWSNWFYHQDSVQTEMEKKSDFRDHFDIKDTLDTFIKIEDL